MHKQLQFIAVFLLESSRTRNIGGRMRYAQCVCVQVRFEERKIIFARPTDEGTTGCFRGKERSCIEYNVRHMVLKISAI